MPAEARATSSAGAAARARHVVFLLYVLIAVVAGVANLATQEGVVRAIPLAPILISVVAGTGVGFVVKYLLDKRFVFLDRYDGHAEEARKVALYGLFSVGTTAIFWVIELGAWHLWGTATAKYIGAALGLALGNWIKYLLDRAWVFRRGRR